MSTSKEKISDHEWNIVEKAGVFGVAGGILIGDPNLVVAGALSIIGGHLLH